MVFFPVCTAWLLFLLVLFCYASTWRLFLVSLVASIHSFSLYIVPSYLASVFCYLMASVLRSVRCLLCLICGVYSSFPGLSSLFLARCLLWIFFVPSWQLNQLLHTTFLRRLLRFPLLVNRSHASSSASDYSWPQSEEAIISLALRSLWAASLL